MTDVEGLCAICGLPAKFTCMLCGKMVCSSHYNTNRNICTDCEKGKTADTDVILNE